MALPHRRVDDLNFRLAYPFHEMSDFTLACVGDEPVGAITGLHFDATVVTEAKEQW